MADDQEELDWAKSIFEDDKVEVRGCVFCAGIHDQVKGLLDYYQPCPRIHRIVRDAAGNILELEFWPNGHWEAGVIFPASIYDNEEPQDGLPS